MDTELPLLGKHQIVREIRLGTGKTDDAVLKTLRKNGAISEGLRTPASGTHGKLAGSKQFYCSLNRDAARAFRKKDLSLAAKYAKAAMRVEALGTTQLIVRELGAINVGATAGALAAALSSEKLLGMTNEVVTAIQKERAKLPRPDVTMMTGKVIGLDTDGALIELSDGGMRLPVPRSILDEEGLAELGVKLAATWEMAGDGIMVMAVDPVVVGSTEDEPQVDMYGTAWGRVLSTSDALFAKSLLERPASEKRPHRPRVRVPIGE